MEQLVGECTSCSVGRCESAGGDITACVGAGQDGFLGDSKKVCLSACVLCRCIIGCGHGPEDALISNF